VSQGPRGSCLMKKTRGQKSRVRVPLILLENWPYTFFIISIVVWYAVLRSRLKMIRLLFSRFVLWIWWKIHLYRYITKRLRIRWTYQNPAGSLLIRKFKVLNIILNPRCVQSFPDACFNIMFWYTFFKEHNFWQAIAFVTTPERLGLAATNFYIG
jgi:hypothetical protein